MLKPLGLLCAGLLLAPFPLTIERAGDDGWVIGVSMAHAEKGSGRDGNRDDRDDDDDDDDDRSGRRGGDDRDDDDDDDDDEDDDEDDEDDDDLEDAGQSFGGLFGGRRSDRGGATVADLHLRYANGWDERILNGQYRLIDPQGRTVSIRAATPDDLARMRALVGQ